MLSLAKYIRDHVALSYFDRISLASARLSTALHLSLLQRSVVTFSFDEHEEKKNTHITVQTELHCLRLTFVSSAIFSDGLLCGYQRFKVHFHFNAQIPSARFVAGNPSSEQSAETDGKKDRKGTFPKRRFSLEQIVQCYGYSLWFQSWFYY